MEKRFGLVLLLLALTVAVVCEGAAPILEDPTSSWSYPPVSSWPPRFRTRTRWLKTTGATVTPEASDGDTTGRTWNRRIRNPLL